MKITRKRETTLERTRSVTIKFNDELREEFCPTCEEKMHFVTIDEAATVREKSSREIFRMVENGQVHFRETSSGRLLICLASLTNLPDTNQNILSKSSE